MAQSWIKKCKCAAFLVDNKKMKRTWYPKRLLDLQELREADGLTEIDGLTTLSEHGDAETVLSGHRDPERAKIRLIDVKQSVFYEPRSGACPMTGPDVH